METINARKMLSFLHETERGGALDIRARHSKPSLQAIALEDMESAAMSENSLAPCSSRTPEHIDLLNRGALVQLRYGELRRAESLSVRAIEICCNNARKNESWWLKGAINPYINLGRLAAVRGERDVALQAFRAYFELANGISPVVVREMTIVPENLLVTANDLSGQEKRNILAVLGGQVYLLEVFRLLWECGTPESLRTFLETYWTSVPSEFRQAYEHSVIPARYEELMALCQGRSADISGALLHLKRCRTIHGLDPLWFYIVTAEINVAAGRIDAARWGWTRALRVLCKHSAKPRNTSINEYAWLRLAWSSLGLRCALSDEGQLLGGLEALTHSLDESVALKALMIKSCCGSVNDRVKAREALISRLDRTCYALERAAGLYIACSNRLCCADASVTALERKLFDQGLWLAAYMGSRASRVFVEMYLNAISGTYQEGVCSKAYHRQLSHRQDVDKRMNRCNILELYYNRLKLI